MGIFVTFVYINKIVVTLIIFFLITQTWKNLKSCEPKNKSGKLPTQFIFVYQVIW